MYDLVVIGSGPGGYVAAIRAAQLGMKVACVERFAAYGGTCLNVGCIPSKALLDSSERYATIQHDLGPHGIEVGEVKLDITKMQERRKSVVKEGTQGIAYLFKKNKIDGVQGHGTIVSPTRVDVKADDGSTTSLETKRILIATGSKPSSLPGITYDDTHIVDSTWALEFDEVPERFLVIGAGYIGLEMGSVWARLGSKVTVLEYLPTILGPMDDELSKEAHKVFKKQGIEFTLNVRVTGAEVKDGEVHVTYEPRDGGEAQTVVGDRLLVAAGRKPYTDGLGLDNIGLETDKRGFIEVDEHFETRVEGVYAIGDVIGGAMLAHKAEEEGVVCVERMADVAGHINYNAIPGIVYTHPEIASVGKTEEELTEAGVPFKKGKFPFMANGRARAMGEKTGFAKILAHAETDRILGAHIIGAHAGDLIAELAVAIEFGAASEDIARSSHAHPTLAEAVKEAALAVEGRTLNF